MTDAPRYPVCDVCDGHGTYPIIGSKGSYRYDIRCPECFGISDEEIERRCAEDRKALEEWMDKQ
jgi:hypothetical protein